MRYIRYAIWLVIAVALIAVALANRELQQLKLLPEGLADIIGINQSINVPVFAIFFGGIVIGLLIGFLWEWMREYKHRAEASRKKGEVHKLERELRRVKGERDKDKDEVLALLDNAS